MVIVKLQGGLGNQLFQWAAAKALANRKNSECKADIEEYKSDTLRGFELKNMNIEVQIASPSEIGTLKIQSTFDRLLQKHIYPHPKKKHYKQPYFHFDKKFYSLPQDIYLEGYFQSEKYFSPVEETLRKEFQIKKDLIQQIEHLSSALRHEQSVALHIRKGDYKDGVINEYHGILPVDYYRKAIEYMKMKVPDPRFYIFTDDKGFDEAELGVDNAILCSGQQTHTHYEDLHLMYGCRHNIIANSSFSWWGAWLNDNPEKIVIAPKQWFNKGPKDTEDLYPESWIQL